jgi:hypothetical protein
LSEPPYIFPNPPLSVNYPVPWNGVSSILKVHQLVKEFTAFNVMVKFSSVFSWHPKCFIFAALWFQGKPSYIISLKFI